MTFCKLQRFFIGLLFTILFAFLPHLTIAAAQADPAGSLAITNESLVFVPVPVHHTFEVIESVTVRNSDANRATVSLSIPNGATAVQLASPQGANSVVKNGILTLHGAVAGKRTATIALSYVMPFGAGNSSSVTFHTQYPIYTAKLYLPTNAGALSAPDLLVRTQTTAISGTTFRVFTRLGIPAGDNWTMTISLLPGTLSSNIPPAVSQLPVLAGMDDNQTNGLQAVWNLLLAVFILLLGLFSVRSTQWLRATGSLSSDAALMQAWESLERRYREGEVPEADYLVQRHQLKGKLISLRRKGRSKSNVPDGAQVETTSHD